ncbi:MAG: hypothetical protein HY917_02955 [Candidatus Diapherotrites archaeon]|nr:hypothetical protein [Candidatus Diapherotrites archaeon]
MFSEALLHLLNLDLTWWVELVLNNLLWVFGLYVAGSFFFKEKPFKGFLAIVFNLFVFLDFLNAGHFVFLVGGMLGIFYIVKFTILKFAEDSPSLRHNLVAINEVSGWLVLVMYNLGWI